MIVTEAGVYDMPAETYHADPVLGGSMSSTTAKHILAPGCPARVEWERRHPVHKDSYDLGTVAHALVLGKGTYTVVEAESWTPKARAQRDEIRAAGGTPILPHQLQGARDMAAAVHAHPMAGALLSEGTGTPELSIFWPDSEASIWRRAMLDWFPNVELPGPIVAVDLKTCDDASLAGCARSVRSYRYYQQAAWYLDGLAAVGIPDATFVFVFVEKSPPHLVQCVEVDAPGLDYGRARNRLAMDVWARCKATDVWPAYSDGIELVGLPRWERTEEYL